MSKGDSLRRIIGEAKKFDLGATGGFVVPGAKSGKTPSVATAKKHGTKAEKSVGAKFIRPDRSLATNDPLMSLDPDNMDIWDKWPRNATVMSKGDLQYGVVMNSSNDKPLVVKAVMKGGKLTGHRMDPFMRGTKAKTFGKALGIQGFKQTQ